MAKQIYIDENGNEQLVSGTINNASLLPISANDPTNTKDYIDSKVASDYYNVTTAVVDNATAQIPASVWAHSFIIVNIRRYGYFGSMIIRKQNIVEGALNGNVCIYVSSSPKYFKINETGLFTALQNFGTDGQWVDFIGIF